VPRFGPISRDRLMRAFRQLGFTGPYAGGNHEYMERRGIRVFIPNPHGTEIGVGLLSKILRQAGVSREEWESL
jgi:predicted RNA binding protein YcfA (HicA-like mRNA interferase family)